MIETNEIAHKKKARSGKKRGKKTEIINNKDIIRARIEWLIKEDGLSYSELKQKFIENGYKNMTAANLRTYIREKRFGLDFLFVLSKVFGVTIDDLISNSNENENIVRSDNGSVVLSDLFHDEICYFYYPPIHKNDREIIKIEDMGGETIYSKKHLLKATWHIGTNNNEIILKIPPPVYKVMQGIQDDLIYTGSLIAYERHIYVNFENNKKEPLQVIFNRSELKENVFFVLGLAVTIRGVDGVDDDVRRLPIVHRFCLTSKKLSRFGERKVREFLDLKLKLDTGTIKADAPIEFSILHRYDKQYYLKLNDADFIDSSVNDE